MNNVPAVLQFKVLEYMEPEDAFRFMATSAHLYKLTEGSLKDRKRFLYSIFWKSRDLNYDWHIHYRVNLRRLLEGTISLEGLKPYYKIDSLMLKKCKDHNS